MKNILLVGLGGSLGAIARYLSNYLVMEFIKLPSFAATMTVNFFGSLIIGFINSQFKNHSHFETIAALLVVGFLGSFTTFSTFSYETVSLFKKGQMLIALANIMASLLFCFSGVLIGEWVSQHKILTF